MKANDERVQKIIKWREVMAALPDQVFFDVVRTHLGEVKTPYNKQKLIEELGAFLQKPEHKETILSLLTREDLTILSAALHIPSCSADMLFAFFSDLSYVRVYDTVLNLEERLLLYRINSGTDKKTVLAVTPYFEDAIREHATPDLLFADIAGDAETEGALPLSEFFFAALFAYALADPDICKADGAIKKRTQARLEEIFTGIKPEVLAETVETLCRAGKQLGLFKVTAQGYIPDNTAWNGFASLSQRERLAYLTAALSFEKPAEAFAIRKYAQMLCGASESAFSKSRSKTALFRAMFLEQAAENARAAAERSRFNALVYRQESMKIDSELLMRLAENAARFGFAGENGEKTAQAEKSRLKIDSIFSVTIFPELELMEQIRLLRFLDLTKFDVVMHCEINKDSATRGFALGVSPDAMTALLCEHSGADPAQTDAHLQNIRASIDEWYQSYSAVRLYKGYILQTAPEHTAKIERLPAMSRRLKHTIAPGVFLVDFSSDDEAASVLERCGLKHGGEIRTAEKPQTTHIFYRIADGRKLNALRAETAPEKDSAQSGAQDSQSGQMREDAQKILDALYKQLDAMNAQAEMTKEQYESLKERIARKIVIDAAQLRAESVRQERNEARGMDFVGKLYIIEQAVAARAMIEIEDGGKKMIAVPTHIEKQKGGAIVTARIEATKAEQRFSVAQLQAVKKMRVSIFRDMKL
jgi:hypothetical protein